MVVALRPRKVPPWSQTTPCSPRNHMSPSSRASWRRQPCKIVVRIDCAGYKQARCTMRAPVAVFCTPYSCLTVTLIAPGGGGCCQCIYNDQLHSAPLRHQEMIWKVLVVAGVNYQWQQHHCPVTTATSCESPQAQHAAAAGLSAMTSITWAALCIT
jgi:hypothetical protein